MLLNLKGIMTRLKSVQLDVSLRSTKPLSIGLLVVHSRDYMGDETEYDDFG